MPDGIAMPAEQYRQPPHNMEAEQALLGAILCNNDSIEQCREIVTGDDFFEPVHGEIFAACIALADKGGVADPVRLKTGFDSHERLKDVGGAQYLVHLAASAAMTTNTAAYATTVKDLSKRREMIKIGEDLIRASYHTPIDEDPAAIIDLVEQDLHALFPGVADGIKTIRTMGEAVDATMSLIETAMRTEGITGVTTGLSELDDAIDGWSPSKLYILAGRPGMGKSALALFYAIKAALAGAGILFYSAEMDAEDNIKRAASNHMKAVNGRHLPYFVMGKRLNQSDFEETARAAHDLRDLPIVWMDEAAVSVQRLRAQVKYQARQLERAGTPLRLLIVDYMQLMKSPGTNGPTEEITAISNGLLAIAKELRISVLALSQLNRGVESRENKRPMLSDLRQSGAIEQDAHTVIFAYRHEYYAAKEEPQSFGSAEHTAWLAEMDHCHGQLELIIAKNRSGPTRTIKIGADMASNHFYDMPEKGVR